MTFSILAYDAENGLYGGAAATGNLCVGAWVLHADPLTGVVASQGHTPNPLWPGQVLQHLRAGLNAEQALQKTVMADNGSHFRQLSVLDIHGQCASFNGENNLAYCGSHILDQAIVAGNMLAGAEVLKKMAAVYQQSSLPLAEKLLACLQAGEKAGGDFRGLQSAALIIVASHHPPLDLRIDDHKQPLVALEALYQKTRHTGYQHWLSTLPTHRKPMDIL